jgi:hypothetical protein
MLTVHTDYKSYRTHMKIRCIQTSEIDKFTSSLLSGKSENVNHRPVVCLATGPQRLPKRVFQTVRSGAFSFSLQYPVFFLRSACTFLCLLPRLPVTFTPSSTFPSKTCFRRQFLHKMCPIQLALTASYCL